MKRWLWLFLLALAVGCAGWLAGYRLSNGVMPWTDPVGNRGGLVGSERPGFSLPGLDGRRHDVAGWDGRVVLLNFWATWCRPCREEMPMLDSLQRRYDGQGLQVVGVALDRPAAVRGFVKNLGIGYPILVDDATGVDIARRYGNERGVLPFTVLIRRDGTVSRIFYGKLERKTLESALSDLI